MFLRVWTIGRRRSSISGMIKRMARWSNVRAIYQIYPRSFYDTNADGVGDLPGIIEKLDYLAGSSSSLGVDAIWISPFYPSPMADFGYDISDYKSVHPMFGTLEDFDRLIALAHDRAIKVMIDFVPNHTSDEHEWFKQSRTSATNEYRDWYVWRDPAPDGGPPNNWLSLFGGPAWQFDELTGQYYLHSFLDKQPDLNWDNPEVRTAMADVLRFWLDRGVDGFRVDAVRWISKDPELRDNPPNPEYDIDTSSDPYDAQLQTNSKFGPELFNYLDEMAEVVERYDDTIIIFEDYPDNGPDHISQYLDFYEHVDPDVAAPFNYDGTRVGYDARELQDLITSFQTAIGSDYRPFYAFGNHDKPRVASRLGREQARLIAVLQLTLPGIPVIYYGEELGMRDVLVSASDVQDPYEKQKPGLGLGRDPQRSPMQWSTDLFAGFSHVKPWLPVAADSDDYNVMVESDDPDSFLVLYRKLLHLRGVSTSLSHGTYTLLPGSTDKIFMYAREYNSERMVVILNVSDQPSVCNIIDVNLIFLSTHTDRRLGRLNESTITLQPHEAVIVR